eukprot:1513371-Amphidinium_carterae.1
MAGKNAIAEHVKAIPNSKPLSEHRHRHTRTHRRTDTRTCACGQAQVELFLKVPAGLGQEPWKLNTRQLNA